MDLTIRALNETDYDEHLVKWWKQWNWEAPPKDFLPNDGQCGVMVMDGDVAICAGFVYITNSKVSWVDWIVSNKEYNKKPQRREAISLLIHRLTNICKESGAKYSYALIKSPSLINVYKDLGYTQGDSYTSEMIKVL
jgi:hypothetical protein